MPEPLEADGFRSSLEIARRELLDLGLRNPLLNYRLLRAKGLEVIREDPAAVFRILVRDERRMTFLPVSETSVDGGGDAALNQPGEDAARLVDLRLQTTYTSAQLQARLLATYYAARTSIEEQGVNTLYLALGMLRWTEHEGAEKNHSAPLILVPVELERNDARDRFHLKYTGEEIGGNESLAEKLKAEFGFTSFPDLPEADDLDAKKYIGEVERLIRRQKDWAVDGNSIVLGFFSFAKHLMYRDLDPSTWMDAKTLLGHNVLQRLIGGDGFARQESRYADDRLLDDQIRGRAPLQVVDADSTQTLAILDALDGRNLIIQGPPGTGKSQTIVNLISAAVAEGKRVLFVSEKMAALDVVKRRLDSAGLGGPCLELHSNRANKKTVLEELKRTLARAAPPGANAGAAVERLAGVRDRLNAYCAAVNEPLGDSGETPRSAYGRFLAVNKEWRGEWANLKLDAAEWSAAETAVRRDLVEKLQQRLARCGIPSRHPFRGCGLTVLLPSDRDEIGRLIKAALDRLSELESIAGSLARICQTTPPTSSSEAEFLAHSATFAASAPELADLDAAHPDWLAREAEIARVLQAGKANAGIRRQYAGILKPESWARDVDGLRQEVDRVGSRWWRFLSRRWRELRQEVQSMCAAPAPRDRAGMLRLLDAIGEASRCLRTTTDANSAMTTLFASHWRRDAAAAAQSAERHVVHFERLVEGAFPAADVREPAEGERGGAALAEPARADTVRASCALDAAASDWSLLERLAAWVLDAQRRARSGSIAPWCLTGTRSIDRSEAKRTADETRKMAGRLEAAAGEWAKALAMVDFGPTGGGPWGAMRERWTAQREALDRLQAYVAFHQIAVECRNRDLSAVVEIAGEWEFAATYLVALFERARLSAVLQRAFGERPALAEFDGGDHSKTVEEFRRLDVLQLAHSREAIAARHIRSLPAAGGSGEIGVLCREFEKKRRHLAIRKLMEGAGHAIQSIKPVFMMSPLSIANYLPPACLEFDLVIFDEASQVKPVDALGAIARGKQIVVVGDSKQLPPTSFFDSLTSDEQPDEDEAPTADIESILGLFSARGAPQRMLQWHYRSRHESLISTSNHLFYDDRLVVFPSPTRERDALGLIYRPLVNAWYDRSRTRTNPVEAKEVAAAVMRQAREQLAFPKDQRETLGVAAFSAAQMDAILNEVELLRRQDPSCEEFFAYPPHEPFFVKNLENVQGDERDVILISIGYARTREGFLAMNFGPLNKPGGERRLNVLISRARRRCEVFTGLSADDIDTSRSPAAGVKALKTFLQYAQTGQMETSAPTGRQPDSDFEEQVKRELEAHGHTVQPQVGCAGFFIDLAVVDAEQPGRYLLGIECDGAAYHSARSARDRDRLRQSVLEGLGWRIHRVWSTDWFRNPEPELRRLLQAIQIAQETPRREPAPPACWPAAIWETPRLPDLPPRAETPRAGAEPYQCATVRLRLDGVAMHEVDTGQLASLLQAVVEVEGPVHWREAARRVTAAAGVQRMGNRIEAAFEEAIRHGTARELFVRRLEFLWSIGMQQPPVRDRSTLPNASRKLELIAPEEIRLSILKAVAESCGMNSSEVPAAVCRVFGFARVTDEMIAGIQPHLEALMKSGDLKITGRNLTVP
jgi:very-short-patch-repair endonuclease